MVIADKSMRLSRAPHPAAYAPSHAGGDALFRLALTEDSNLEMDWLWVAGQLARADQRAYSYLRALEINPCSAAAKSGLAQVLRQDGRAAVIAGTLLGRPRL